MDWLKGKSTGNHGFSQENNENMGGSGFNFPFNQSIDKDPGMYSRTPFEHWKKHCHLTMAQDGSSTAWPILNTGPPKKAGH